MKDYTNKIYDLSVGPIQTQITQLQFQGQSFPVSTLPEPTEFTFKTAVDAIQQELHDWMNKAYTARILSKPSYKEELIIDGNKFIGCFPVNIEICGYDQMEVTMCYDKYEILVDTYILKNNGRKIIYRIKGDEVTIITHCGNLEMTKEEARRQWEIDTKDGYLPVDN